MPKLKNYTFVLLSAILIFLSYPKISISPLIFISLIPFITVIINTSEKKEAIKYGFILGASTYLLLLYWIIPTLLNGGVNLLLSTVALFLLSLILSFEFIIWSYFIYIAKNCSVNMFIYIAPALMVLIEFIKIQITKYIPYFPWFSFSYTQWNNPYILNLSSVGGMYIITFIIVLINALFATIITIKDKKSKIKRTIIAFLIIIISISYGRIKQNDIKNIIESSNKTIKIAIIQPSIDFYKKWNQEYINEIKFKIEKLLNEVSVKNPDLIIWPENSLYGWIDDEEVFTWLCNNIKKTKTYNIIGSVSKINQKHVSLYLLDENCKIKGEYHKRLLVPFGEYVPFRKFIGKFVDVITGLGEFEKGDFKQKPLIFKDYKIGATICYENIFDYLFYPDDDIDFFVNITNDGWYLDTSAPYQHFVTSILRACENQRTLIRSANNGISAVIYPDGSIKKKLELNDYNYIYEEIKIINIEINRTLEKNIFVYISLMIFFAFILAFIFR